MTLLETYPKTLVLFDMSVASYRMCAGSYEKGIIKSIFTDQLSRRDARENNINNLLLLVES